MSKLYLSVDIEKAGDRFVDPVLMIGCCLGDEKGEVIESKAFCGVVPENKDFEPRCWNEFWVHNLDVLSRIRRNSTKTMLEDFMNYFYGLDERFGPFTKNGEKQLIILTDNPTFDITAIDCMLCMDAEKRFPLPLHYTKSGEYIKVVDCNALFKLLSADAKKRVKDQASKNVSHDHWAENDAIVMYNTKVLSDQVFVSPSSNEAKVSAPLQNVMRPGDWWCNKCKDFVFASRTECRKCGTKK